ncbi:indoleacetamide hydrolase [Phaeobacter gallaeciensis]|jgi:mandelamide amidase|uniref:indoleacetamide hydrolase n=1 Tax=Phaeobacter gallaeciensis TaxID=60890 RepID=UPI00237F1C48|nr:indoleacetamide hydrolase [Phaeobacter gallaeciensis]MDE4303669.1 indoleacetamide hydrolase [Phaeobacter gallaeciensis]MDE4307850.1 indoleacetamide hydrolase [Phaeobacter gallaeciensis]MDE4312308.1 indoleacetamide hydrolase [Phaeobacter gallaeciensis]MDE4316779.1 indoleacetamide hydrolase [Phaeobacter gallaeciensis]MDE4321242.1 indoleacetamide hydrolase [Phaeobacter gallaeciensis]
MTLDLERLDAVATVAALKEGSVSPAAYAEALAERAAKNADLNALQSFDAGQVVQAAAAAFKAHPEAVLAGLPIVAKDNINTTAYPTSGGTKALLRHTPATDAGVVQRITKAGGFIGAKAGMHELAFGITSNNAVTGAVHNPADPGLIAGGSSGGTAAAVAAGIFPAGLGTDTGGSCRIPAALCGVIGFRPTTGRYNSDGVVPISHTRDTVGTLARSTRDIALFDGVLSGDDAALAELAMTDVTLGVPRNMFYDNLDPVVAAAVEAQLSVLSAAGAKLVDVDFDGIWPHNEAFSFPVVFYEVMRDLPAYLAEHAPEVSFETLIKGIGSPDVAGAIGSQLGDEAMPEAAYRAAMDVHRPAMRQIYGKVFEDNGLDAIVFPTTPLPARPIGEDETVTLNGDQCPTFPTYIRNTDLGSNIGAPGISLPCPVSSGLPVGIEFDGLPGKDRALLALARAAEKSMAR